MNIWHDLMYISDVAIHVKARNSMEESQMLLWHPPAAFGSLEKMASNFIAIILIIWTVGYSSSTHNSHNPLNGQHLRVIWVCYSKIRSHNSNWIGNYFLFISHYGKEILKDCYIFNLSQGKITFSSKMAISFTCKRSWMTIKSLIKMTHSLYESHKFRNKKTKHNKIVVLVRKAAQQSSNDI